MSRIGKLPITIPSGVTVDLGKDSIVVKGAKDTLIVSRCEVLTYVIDGNTICIAQAEETRLAREQHGLRRTLLANAIEGVSKGFEKTLEVLGVGYRVAVKGKVIELAVGFSHPVVVDIPEGLTAKVEGQKLTIIGVSKEHVGQFAAKVRSIRKPEPYKGKGIRYEGENVRRKAGKSSGKGK